MSTHQVHVFISHAWAHSGHYVTIAGWIFGQPWSTGQASVSFRNYSVPRDDRIHDAPNTAALQAAIFRQIAMSHVLVIPTGMYAAYSKWIQREIDGAKGYGKPIVAVHPWAQERRASVVARAADATVGWNREPLLRAIWDLHFRGGGS